MFPITAFIRRVHALVSLRHTACHKNVKYKRQPNPAVPFQFCSCFLNLMAELSLNSVYRSIIKTPLCRRGNITSMPNGHLAWHSYTYVLRSQNYEYAYREKVCESEVFGLHIFCSESKNCKHLSCPQVVKNPDCIHFRL